MKGLAMQVVVLTLICTVVSGILVFTYSITDPIITENKALAAEAARTEILPMADSFEKFEGELPDGVVEVYAATNGTGMVVSSTASGYGGPIVVMTGIDADGKITMVKLLEHTETPNLGDKVGKEDYTSQYIGKDSSLEGVESIGGATVSSSAFKKCVDIAYAAYTVVGGGEVADPNEPDLALLPGADSLTAVEGALPEGVQAAYSAVNGSGMIILTTAEGYGGTMTVLTGIADGVITGVKLGANAETPGIGDKVMEESYTSQYVGKDAGTVADVEGIVGTTVSANAYKEAVQKALTAYAELNGEVSTPPTPTPSATPAPTEAPTTAVTYETTPGPTAIELTDAVMAEILPEADSFVEWEGTLPEGVVSAYTASNGSGMIITSATQGYKSEIVVATGINAEGSISMVKLLEENETDGLGDKIEDEDYTSLYTGNSSFSRMGRIESIVGSTVSTDAFKQSVLTSLALYNEINKPTGELTNDIMAEMLPAADSFVKQEGTLPEGVQEVYTAANGAGMVVMSASMGYRTDIVVATAIGSDGNITMVKLLAQNETPGIGDLVGEESYTSQYVGKDASLTDIEGIAGSTVSADAFKVCVQSAFAAYDALN